MASIQESIRRLTIVANERGVDEATRKLRGMATAQGGVTIASQSTERASTTLERRLGSLERRYDATARSTHAYASAEKTLNVAVGQGLVSLARKSELLSLVAAKHAVAAQATTSHANALRGLAGSFALFGGGALGAGFLRAIDTNLRIENSLRVAGLAGEQLTSVYDALFQSAQRNAAPLEALVVLYSRVSLSQRELKASAADMLTFTDRVALALRVSGKSAQESSGALLQLSQALGASVVRAEEFNSLIEGAQPILEAAAHGIEEAGGSISKLPCWCSKARSRPKPCSVGSLQDLRSLKRA